MIFKRSGKHIYGVELTANERKALDAEAGRAMGEYIRKNDLEIEAIVIRQVRRHTGWGETRLRRFYNDLDDGLQELVGRYEMETSDAPWLCMRELKSEGFDIEQWHREKHPNEKYIVKSK